MADRGWSAEVAERWVTTTLGDRKVTNPQAYIRKSLARLAEEPSPVPAKKAAKKAPAKKPPAKKTAARPAERNAAGRTGAGAPRAVKTARAAVPRALGRDEVEVSVEGARPVVMRNRDRVECLTGSGTAMAVSHVDARDLEVGDRVRGGSEQPWRTVTALRDATG